MNGREANAGAILRAFGIVRAIFLIQEVLHTCGFVLYLNVRKHDAQLFEAISQLTVLRSKMRSER